MRLREIVVQNFRGFAERQVIPLSERFTVIAGVNGRGKTSLLDGLASILMRFLAELDLSNSNRFGRWKVSDIRVGAEGASVSISALCAGIPVQGYRVNLERVAGRAERLRIDATNLPASVTRSIVAAYGDPAKTNDQAPVAVYYSTDRAGYRLPKKLPTDLPPLRQVAYRGALSNRMVDYRDLMARYRLWAGTPESKERKALDSALSIFLEGFGDLEIEEEPLRLTLRKGDVRLSLQQLSDGERAFLAVLGDMVRRLALANPELENPLEGYGVVLIDELELHLHPQWQREVVEKLRHTFPNIQFIATTHSPFIIQSLRPGELISLDPDDAEYAGKSIEDIAEGVMGVEVPQKSRRFLSMMEAAEEYYVTLDLARSAQGAAQLEQLKQRLDELALPFADDPAYQAYLRFQRGRILKEAE